MQSIREYIATDEAMARLFRSIDVAHIAYDPALRERQYTIYRTSAHDGGCGFSVLLLIDALTPIVYGSSYYTPDGFASDAKGEHMEYTVGRIRRAAVIGRINCPAGNIPGMTERLSLPVVARIVTVYAGAKKKAH